MRNAVTLGGIVVALLVGACTPSDEDQASSPSQAHTNLIPATEARPYSVELPMGWTVEETVHSDGSSFVVGTIGDAGTSDSGGKLFGVVAPSGQVVRFDPVPTKSAIHAMEADGSRVEVDRTTSIDGYPGWEMLLTPPDGSGVTLITEAEVAGGAGISLWLGTADPNIDVEALRTIVASVRVDEDLLVTALEGASA